MRDLRSSVAAVQSCFCFIIVAAVIVLGIGALFLLFVLLYSQRVSSQSCETLGELLHHPANAQATLYAWKIIICVGTLCTGSRGLHINKGNAKLEHNKACKRCRLLKIHDVYLLADWSNLLLHIHDDYRCTEVLVCHFEMFAVGVRSVPSGSF